MGELLIALFGNELMLFFVQFVWVWGLFLVRGPFRQFFLGRAYIGGEAYTWMNIYILKAQFFVQAIVIF